MKIGVLSDTHIPIAAPSLPKEILSAFKGVDLIFHAGDMVEASVLKELKKIARVYAVRGNMDSKEVADLLPRRLVIPVGKFKIGIFHGYGAASKLVELLKEEFRADPVDSVVFGHSHTPFNEAQGGILFFNPGSPTDKTCAPYNSFGILEVNDKISGEIIRLS